jgi:hypothetical protein
MRAVNQSDGVRMLTLGIISRLGEDAARDEKSRNTADANTRELPSEGKHCLGTQGILVRMLVPYRNAKDELRVVVRVQIDPNTIREVLVPNIFHIKPGTGEEVVDGSGKLLPLQIHQRLYLLFPSNLCE